MEGVDHLADERRTTQFDVESMKIVWAGSQHAFDVSDRMSKIVANDHDGRRVHIIERYLTEQDRIVGELLQPGGHLKLIELGLEDCVNEIDAQRVFGYALYMDV